MHSRRSRFVLSTIAVAFVLSSSAAQAQPNPYPSNPYRLVSEWAPQLPAGMKLGQVVAADPAPDGSLYIVHRCEAHCIDSPSVPPIVKVDASGKLLRSWGEGMFVWPHGATVDREGNLWVADAVSPSGMPPKPAGARGHQVIKFSPEGKVLLTLGKAGVLGAGPDTFNAPGDVAIGANGDIYVSDGHGAKTNARIVKFSRDGRFLKAWGSQGSGRDNLDGPHSIEVGPDGRVYVADRGNNRITVLDADLNVVALWTQFGRPSGVAIHRDGTIFVSDTQPTTGRPGWRNGIYVGSIKDGMVTAFIPPVDEKGSMEGVAVDAAGNVYASDVDGRTVKKFSKP